jgi:molecular chaperone DnaK (HSP70)
MNETTNTKNSKTITTTAMTEKARRPTSPAAEPDPNLYIFQFEGASAIDRGVQQTEMAEDMPSNPFRIDSAEKLEPLEPPEKTIYQKLEEIANRAKAKKREIDEEMNMEMVELFSAEARSKSAKSAAANLELPTEALGMSIGFE